MPWQGRRPVGMAAGGPFHKTVVTEPAERWLPLQAAGREAPPRASLSSIMATEQHQPRLTGAYLKPGKRRWAARIYVDGKMRHLGYFDTASLAHEAFVRAREATPRKPSVPPPRPVKRSRPAVDTPFVPLCLKGAAFVSIGQGLHAMVDVEDFDRIARYRWRGYRHRSRNTWYAERSSLAGEKGDVTMHRAVLGYDGLIDHRDGNGLNNRKGNLRPATPAGNARNRGLNRKPTAAGYKGVQPWRRKFRARIKVNRKWIYLGLFHTPEEGARAYDAAARQHFGEFAALNFPGPGEQSARRG